MSGKPSQCFCVRRVFFFQNLIFSFFSLEILRTFFLNRGGLFFRTGPYGVTFFSKVFYGIIGGVVTFFCPKEVFWGKTRDSKNTKFVWVWYLLYGFVWVVVVFLVWSTSSSSTLEYFLFFSGDLLSIKSDQKLVNPIDPIFSEFFILLFWTRQQPFEGSWQWPCRKSRSTEPWFCPKRGQLWSCCWHRSGKKQIFNF